jgi:hypothetical protein
MRRLSLFCLLPILHLCACRTSDPAAAQLPGEQPEVQPEVSEPTRWPGSAPLPEAAELPEAAPQSAVKPAQPVQPTHAYLLELRQRRAAETDASRRAELDLESARVLWQLEGPGPARGLYEQLAADSAPAIALQSRIASANLGAMDLEQRRAAAAREHLRKALGQSGVAGESRGGAATALPGALEWTTRANLALAEAILEPSPARFQALETAAVALERAGLVDEAQAMRRNRERLGGRN